MSEPRSFLEARRVDVRYPSGRTALEDVSLSVTPGELTAVIGPNGSGKSTLVRCLSRTLAPHSGAVLLDGVDLYRDVTANQSARAIAVVPQTTDVFLDFTVRDIVAMGRAPFRAARGLFAPDTPEDQAAVDSALERMSLGQALAERPIGEVSGGERQRTLIARALAQEARILLLDEPTSALDLQNQGLLIAWMTHLAHSLGRAVVVVLHDLTLAAQSADRLVMLGEGRVVAEGTPEEVLTPRLIETVYGARVSIGSGGRNGRPLVVPEPLDLTAEGAPEPS